MMRKKLLSIILVFCLVAAMSACGENDGDHWNPEVPEREVLQEEDCMCGVYYFNYPYEEFSGREKNRAYYDGIFKSTGSLERFPFLKKIPDANIVATPMGTEIYLIIPADPKARVDVYLMELDETMFTTQRAEKPFYSSTEGNPFLLQCNYGDLFSDAQIVITDSEENELVWSPSISLRDGRVFNRTDDGATIYDFTDYEEIYEMMDD